MNLSLVIHPDERLRLMSEPVAAITPEVRDLAAAMLEEMYASQGFGLAAIQVGVAQRIVVMDLAVREGDRNPRVFINPEVVAEGEDWSRYNEGCLSLPGLYMDVERPHQVRIRYMDLEGKTHEEDADDLLARCFQHELDHLNGKLIIDRVSRLKREMALKKYEKLRKGAQDETSSTS